MAANNRSGVGGRAISATARIQEAKDKSRDCRLKMGRRRLVSIAEKQYRSAQVTRLVEGRETHDGANASPFVHLDDLLDCLHTLRDLQFPSFKHGFAAFAFRIVQIQVTGYVI
jgi:hypothetical protein